jgi:hypothetical protein
MHVIYHSPSPYRNSYTIITSIYVLFPHSLQIPRPLLTLPQPLLQQRPIPRLKPDLEVLWLERQTRRNRIRLQTIHNRLVPLIHRLRKLKRTNQPHKRRVQLAIRQVTPNAHATPRAVPVMRRARAIGHVEVALGVKCVRVGEVRVVVIGSVRIHVERSPCWESHAVVFNVLYALARQGNGDDGPVAQDFLVECRDVGDFFFLETFVPGVVVGVHFENLGVRAALDGLARGRGELGDAHYQVAWHRVEARGYHG